MPFVPLLTVPFLLTFPDFGVPFLGIWNSGVRKFTINERRVLLGGMWF